MPKLNDCCQVNDSVCIFQKAEFFGIEMKNSNNAPTKSQNVEINSNGKSTKHQSTPTE